jgi:O-antigen ligase
MKERAVKFCQAAVNFLLLAVIFLVPVYFAFFYEIFSVFVLYKIAILRILVSAAFILWLAKVFLEGKIAYRAGKYIFLSGLLLSLSWFVSSFFSADPALSFWGSFNRQEGFWSLFFYLLFFFLLILSLKNFVQVRRLAGAVLASVSVVCLYGLAQFFSFDPLKWAEPFSATGRIFSTLGQPNFLGHFLILTVPFSVYAIFFLSRRFWPRFFLFFLLFSQLFCLVFTASRSAWIALSVEIFLAVLAALLARGRKKTAVGLIIISLAGLSLLGCFSASFAKIAIAADSPIYRFASVFDASQGSVRGRLNIWQSAIAEIKGESPDRLMFGHGPDSLSEIFALRYQGAFALDETINTWADRAHNLFLDIILQFGLAGLLAYCLFLSSILLPAGYFFRSAPRDKNFYLAAACLIALAGYFANNLFSFSDIANHLYFFLLLGLLVFAVSRSREETEIKISLNVYSRLAIFAGFLILAVIFIYFYNFRPLVADFYFMKSIKIGFGDCPEVLDNNKKAIRLGSVNGDFYQGEYLYNGLKCFDSLPAGGSKEKLKENMILFFASLPADSFYPAKYRANVEARLAVDSGEASLLNRAEKNFENLALKYPQIASLYEDWANFEFARGDYGKAIEAADRGLAVLPLSRLFENHPASHRREIEAQLVRFYDFLGAAYAQKKESGRALLYYEKIIGVNPYYSVVYQKIADIYRGRGDWEKALWYNERGLSLEPENYYWPFAAGLLYEEQGIKDKAIIYFEKALKLSPAGQKEEIKKHLDGLKF